MLPGSVASTALFGSQVTIEGGSADAADDVRPLFGRDEADQARQRDHPFGDADVFQNGLRFAPAVVVDGDGDQLRGDQTGDDDQNDPAGDAVRQQAPHARSTAGVNT